MKTTIFDALSYDRSIIQWEKYVYTMTPVQKIEGMWFKREDHFAPLGYGGGNGTKLRQLIDLVYRECVKKGLKGVVHGSVSGSPQHPLVAMVCKHYGLDNIDVVGTNEI